MRAASPFRAEVLSVVAALAAAVYVAVVAALPLLDTRLNVLTAHPEDYASGGYRVVVSASYVALAIALASLAGALLPLRRREIGPVVLMLPPIALCLALAGDPIGVARGGWVLIPVVALAAMPLASALLMGNRFGGWTRALRWLGLAVAAALIALAAAPEAVSGIVNRVFDVLAGGWVVAAGLALRRQARSRPPVEEWRDRAARARS